MARGKNGQQLAAENVARVEEWIRERTACRDWHECEYNGRVNRRALAEELDFARSVCTQNLAVRSLLEAAEQLWFGSGSQDRAAHEAARERAEKRSGREAAANSQLVRRIAELEAQVYELRKQLAAFKRQQELVSAGEAGFRV